MEKLLEGYIEEHLAATILERHRLLGHITGEALSNSAAKRLLKRFGFSQKSNSYGGDGARRTAKSRLGGDGRREIVLKRLVFVDDIGTNTSLAPLHAWAPRGERERCFVPRNRGEFYRPSTLAVPRLTVTTVKYTGQDYFG